MGRGEGGGKIGEEHNSIREARSMISREISKFGHHMIIPHNWTAFSGATLAFRVYPFRVLSAACGGAALVVLLVTW